MATLLWPPTTNALQKQLNADYTASDAVITLTNTTGVQNKPGVIVINRIDTNSALQPAASWTYIQYTGTSGATLTGCTAVSGDQDHAIGEVVEFVPDVTWAQAINDVITEAHNEDGTHKSGLALTSPVLTAPQINDTSADHQYILGVSELTADRTVTLPLLTGNDDFVFEDHTQTLTNKTLTSPTINGINQSWDGWITATDTWTYASASTFTISGVDRTAVLTKGTKIKLTQTTAKYFYVVSSAFSTNTTVTVTGGTDYTLANASITSPYYSYMQNPQGFPAYFNYATTITSTTGGDTVPTYTTNTGRFVLEGSMCTWWFYLLNSSGGTAGSGTGLLQFSLPIAGQSLGQGERNGAGMIYEGGGGTVGHVITSIWTSTTMGLAKSDTALATPNDQSDVSRALNGILTYRIA